MRKIYISAGHSNKIGRDRGASGNGFIEGELTAEFRKLLVKELNLLGTKPITDADDTIFSQTINYFRNLVDSKAIVLDIHWNSATPQAKGTETLIPGKPSSFETELAEELSKTVGETLDIPLRGKSGVKTELESHHKKLAWMSLTGENVLMEVCFISNKNEMQSYQNKKEELAKNIAKVLFNFANEVKSNIYVVKKGDSLSKIAKENKTTVEKIKKDNSLKTDIIQIGQQIKL